MTIGVEVKRYVVFPEICASPGGRVVFLKEWHDVLLVLYVAFVMQMAAGAGIRHKKTLPKNKSWWREMLLCVQGFTRAWSAYITGTRTLPSRAAESLLSSAALPNLITLQVEVAVLLEGACSLGLLILMINMLIRSCRTSRL